MNTKLVKTIEALELIKNYCVNEPTTQATLGELREALSAIPSDSEESQNYSVRCGARYYRQHDIDSILYPAN